MKKLLISFCLISASLKAQQLDMIGKKGGLKVSGGLGVSNSLYMADGIANRINPYSYALSGNVNLNFYGVSLPFSFTYSNQNYAYRQPFNIYGLSPTYKRFTFHLGYRNLSFSPYTLNGHNFLGGGVEYKSKAFSVIAMGGRLLKAVEYDSSNKSALPSYQRMGAGLKLNYTWGKDEISLIGFYAKDDYNSIQILPAILGLKPQENMVLSIGGKKVMNKLTLQAEAARSAWTGNQNTEAIGKNGNIINSLYFIPWKQSTLVYDAFKASANYNFTFMTLGTTYEKVEPEFRTLGAYYFNNDLENITLNLTAPLFKNKVNLSANGGLQRDDLNNTKSAAMTRKVRSLSLNMNPSKRLNLNFSYSNFYSFINIKPTDVRFLQNTSFSQIDTLNYTQLSQTINGAAGYKLSDNDYLTRSINVNGSLMKTSNKQGRTTQGNQLLNETVAYSQAWKKSGVILGVTANANQTSYETGQSVYLGAGLNAVLPVFQKKLRISFNLNVNQNYEKEQLVARLYSLNNGYSVRIGKKHSINGNLRLSRREKIQEATLGRYNSSFNELMATVGYNFTF